MRSSLLRVRAVAGLSLREALRRRVVLAAFAMTVGFLGLYALGIHYAARDLQPGAGGPLPDAFMAGLLRAQMLYIGLFPASMIVGFVAVMASAGAVSGEVDTGVLHAVLARPIRRRELLAGKFLGIGSMVAAYAVVLSAAVMWLVCREFGGTVPNAGGALALLALEPLLLLGVSLLGTSRFPTVATGVLCVAGYGIAFVGGFMEQIGAAIKSDVLTNIGIVSSLLMPVDAMHRKALALTLPGSILGSGQVSPFGFAGTAVPSAWMVVYAALYLLGALLLAARWLRRRDL